MTYNTKIMNDQTNRIGAPWPKGTFRIYHNDNRKCWSVSEPGDQYRYLAWCSWLDAGGEFYDGSKWRPMKEYDNFKAQEYRNSLN